MQAKYPSTSTHAQTYAYTRTRRKPGGGGNTEYVPGQAPKLHRGVSFRGFMEAGSPFQSAGEENKGGQLRNLTTTGPMRHLKKKGKMIQETVPRVNWPIDMSHLTQDKVSEISPPPKKSYTEKLCLRKTKQTNNNKKSQYNTCCTSIRT